MQSKAGQPLARYFPDVVTALGNVHAQEFVVDGELVVPVGGALSFDELQLRLHPAASRVQKLAKANPALYILFDILAEDGEIYLQQTVGGFDTAQNSFDGVQTNPLPSARWIKFGIVKVS